MRDLTISSRVTHSTDRKSWSLWLRIVLFGFGSGFWMSTVLSTVQHQLQQPVETTCNTDNHFSFSKADFRGPPKTVIVNRVDLTTNEHATDDFEGDHDESADKDESDSRSLALTRKKITSNATTAVDSEMKFGDGAKKANMKQHNPMWWKRYVSRLARIWRPRAIDSWCGTLEPDPPTPKLLNSGQVAEGMIYIKSYKASSSTCEGIALSIAHHVGRRQRKKALIEAHSASNTSVPAVCRAYTRHEFADKRLHARRDRSTSLLWTFVRNPAARDLSHVYHFEIGRKNRTNLTSMDIQKRIQLWIRGRQTRYLVRAKTSRAQLWPLHEIKRNRTEIISYMKEEIFSNYDFLGLTERMPESLAVMVLLWDLQPEDVIVLNSKTSGGYDDGGENNTCISIPKAVMTPELKEYFETRHSIWNADVLLYHAANASLQMTIDSLGQDRVQRMAQTIEVLQRRAHKYCLEEARFPCSPEGVYQPELAKQSCYVQDAGCGHACVDRILSTS